MSLYVYVKLLTGGIYGLAGWGRNAEAGWGTHTPGVGFVSAENLQIRPWALLTLRGLGAFWRDSV